MQIHALDALNLQGEAFNDVTRSTGEGAASVSTTQK